jgi:hypothetical protein
MLSIKVQAHLRLRVPACRKNGGVRTLGDASFTLPIIDMPRGVTGAPETSFFIGWPTRLPRGPASLDAGESCPLVPQPTFAGFARVDYPLAGIRVGGTGGVRFSSASRSRG